MANKYWEGGADNWVDSTHWLGGEPGAGDNAIVNEGSAVNADNLYLDRETITLHRSGTAPLYLYAVGTSFGPSEHIISNAAGGPIGLTVGNTWNLGFMQAVAGEEDITIAAKTGFVNYGHMNASGTSGAKIEINANNGNFGNANTMTAGNGGSIDVAFAAGPSQPTQTLWNFGIMQTLAGGEMTISSGRAFTSEFGIFQNYGFMDVSGGTMTIDTQFQQISRGWVHAEAGGVLNMYGSSDGGTIEITNATMNFGLFEHDGPQAPQSAGEFKSNLVLDGQKAALGFGNIPITEAFNAATQELSVFTPFEGAQLPVGTFHLTGAQRYSAADFSVANGTVLWQHHTATTS